MSNDDLHRVIKEEFTKAGMEPVKFDKPLKSVGVFVRLRKELKPDNLSERGAIIGWGLGNLVEHYGKELFNIKSVTLLNERDKVTIEAIVYMSELTFEDDHDAWLDGLIEHYAGEDYIQHGYYWKPRYFNWDSAERISDTNLFLQQDGSGNLQAAPKDPSKQ